MSQSALWGSIISFGFVAIGFVIALSKKGRVGVTTIGSRRRELFVPGDPATVFARLQRINPRLRIDDASPGSTQLVLSTPPSLFTWGFLYPVNIQEHVGGSRVEIGIRSRLFQIGPIVSRAHMQCVNDVSQVLGVPAARVA